MKQREIEELAIRVLQHLATLSNGSELSTYEAVQQVFERTDQEPRPDAIEFEDWFTLNRLIWDKSGIYGLKLDDSKYAEKAPLCKGGCLRSRLGDCSRDSGVASNV